MAQLRDKSIVIEADYTLSAIEWAKQEKDTIEAAKAEVRRKAKGALVGEILRWSRADGYAQYMVVKESPLTLAHLEIGDSYSVEYALIRGLRKTDVLAMVEHERGMRKLFNG